MSYFNTEDPVPEGYVLIPGKMLSATARSAKIEFRLAYHPRKPGEASHAIPYGLLILAQDKPALDQAIARRDARREHEKKHCDPTKR